MINPGNFAKIQHQNSREHRAIEWHQGYAQNQQILLVKHKHEAGWQGPIRAILAPLSEHNEVRALDCKNNGTQAPQFRHLWLSESKTEQRKARQTCAMEHERIPLLF